ncbi:MAG: tetratricopeptide repeat protein [Bacteroidales bacterium]|nr:tetratricopeptide repeat protein [Bacteroidales bacterium]
MKPIAILWSCLFALNAWSQDLSTALKLSNSQQYEEAAKVFEELVKTNPANGDIYYYYGETLIKDYLSDTFSNSLDEYARKAETLFQTGIKQAPGNVLNQIGMGAITLLRTSDTTKALPYFAAAEAAVPLKLKKKEFTPDKAVILTKLATAQLFGKIINYKKTFNYLNRAKVINPADPEIYLATGDVYLKQNDASNALVNYNQALIKDPKSPKPKIKIGNIYMRVPNINAARPYFEDALAIDSTYAPVYRSLGELWTMAGRHDLAKSYFKKYVTMSGNSAPAMVRYGNSLFRSKDYAGALEVIEEVLKVDNTRNYLNRLAAYSCYEKKPQDLEKGLQYMETFLKNANPDNLITRDYVYYGHLMYKLATANDDSIMLNKAFEQLKKAYSMDESDKNLLTEIAMNNYYNRRYKDAIELLKMKAAKGWAGKNDAMTVGKCYYQLKDLTNADKAFSEIIASDPDNIEAHLFLARTYSLMENDPVEGRAAPKFEAMIKQIGTRGDEFKQPLYEAYKYLAYHNYQAGRSEAAHSWYDKWLNLDSNNKEWQVNALRGKAMIDFKRKDWVSARDDYNRVLAIDPNNVEAKKFVTDLTKIINAERNLR